MMRYLLRVPLLAMGLLVACTTPDDDLAEANLVADSVTVRWGTSFGMCAGYCRIDMEISGATLRLTREGWRSANLPKRVEEQPISRSDLNSLVNKLLAAKMSELQEVYGCPDCADGGAEYVELENGSTRKRVTFEFNRGPRELEAALTELRALRQRFPAQ